jgi:hypothetical protein
LSLFLLLALASATQAGEWRQVTAAEGLPSGEILDICGSPGRGQLWLASSAGVHVVQREEFLEVAEGPARALAPGPGGTAYVLFPDRIERALAGDTIPLPDGGLTRIWSEEDGTILWGSGSKGTWRREGDRAWESTGNPEPTALPPLRPDDTPDFVTKVVVAGDAYWGLGKGGLWRRPVAPWVRWRVIPGADRVNALARHGRTLYCGTENGLATVEEDGSVRLDVQVAGVKLGVVTGLAVDREGRLWVGSGSSFPGVLMRDADGKWTRFTEIESYVHRIGVDPAGTVWFAGLNRPGGAFTEGGGSWYFADGKFEPAVASGDLPSARVYDVVTRDPSGTLWFATLKGLLAFDGGQPRKFDLPGESVFTLCAARDGSLWIGYRGHPGASRLVRGAVTHFTAADGLCGGDVWAIAEGPPGTFWFATPEGLGRYDGLRWSCFPADDYFGAALWPLLPDGAGGVWVGTLGADLAHFRPFDTDPPATTPEREEIDVPAGKRAHLAWTGTDAWLDTPRAELWYRWRVDGGRWSDPSPANAADLDLEAGEHVVEIQSIDRVGNVEEVPARVAVRVAAAAAWWFWPLLALVLVVVVTGRRAKRGS